MLDASVLVLVDATAAALLLYVVRRADLFPAAMDEHDAEGEAADQARALGVMRRVVRAAHTSGGRRCWQRERNHGEYRCSWLRDAILAPGRAC